MNSSADRHSARTLRQCRLRASLGVESVGQTTFGYRIDEVARLLNRALRCGFHNALLALPADGSTGRYRPVVHCQQSLRLLQGCHSATLHAVFLDTVCVSLSQFSRKTAHLLIVLHNEVLLIQIPPLPFDSNPLYETYLTLCRHIRIPGSI